MINWLTLDPNFSQIVRSNSTKSELFSNGFRWAGESVVCLSFILEQKKCFRFGFGDCAAFANKNRAFHSFSKQWQSSCSPPTYSKALASLDRKWKWLDPFKSYIYLFCLVPWPLFSRWHRIHGYTPTTNTIIHWIALNRCSFDSIIINDAHPFSSFFYYYYRLLDAGEVQKPQRQIQTAQ